MLSCVRDWEPEGCDMGCSRVRRRRRVEMRESQHSPGRPAWSLALSYCGLVNPAGGDLASGVLSLTTKAVLPGPPGDSLASKGCAWWGLTLGVSSCHLVVGAAHARASPFCPTSLLGGGVGSIRVIWLTCCLLTHCCYRGKAFWVWVKTACSESQLTFSVDVPLEPAK